MKDQFEWRPLKRESASLAQKQWFTSRCKWGILVQQEGRVFVWLWFSTTVQAVSEHGVLSKTSWSMKLCWTAFVFWALSVPTVQGKLARPCESNSTTVNKLHNTINATGGYVLVNYRHGPNRVACLLKKYEYTYSVRQNIILAASRGNPCWCWWRYALAPVCALLCAFPCSLFANRMVCLRFDDAFRPEKPYGLQGTGAGLGMRASVHCPVYTALSSVSLGSFFSFLYSPFCSLFLSYFSSFSFSSFFFLLFLLLENNNQWHFH